MQNISQSFLVLNNKLWRRDSRREIKRWRKRSTTLSSAEIWQVLVTRGLQHTWERSAVLQGCCCPSTLWKLSLAEQMMLRSTAYPPNKPLSAHGSSHIHQLPIPRIHHTSGLQVVRAMGTVLWTQCASDCFARELRKRTTEIIWSVHQILSAFHFPGTWVRWHFSASFEVRASHFLWPVKCKQN